MMINKSLSVRDICFIGIFTAVIAVSSFISIPMPFGVPMTLQTLAIPLAGVVLGGKKGTLSVIIYILLGAVGLPIFSGFKGGLGVVFGSTGGFILSFPFMALSAGAGSSSKNKLLLAFGLTAGAVINFLCGMIMFSAVTGNDLQTSFMACVLPFIPTAVIKAALAGLLGERIRLILEKGQFITPNYKSRRKGVL